MKNLFKKIGALLVAAVMVLSMCTAVFADGNSATITLTNFNDADSVKYMQIIEPDPSQQTGWKFSNAVAKDAFTAATGENEQNTLWMLILKATPRARNNAALNIPDNLNEITNAQIDKALSTIKSNEAAIWITLNENERTSMTVTLAGVYAFDAEKEGYTYKVATAYVGFGTYEETPTLQNTSVAAKRSQLTIDKIVADDDNAVAIGDTVDYTITTFVPYIDANNTESRTFSITDEINGATYVTNSEGKVAGTVTLGEGNKAQTITVDIDPSTDGKSFSINLDSLVADADNPNAAEKVTVTYQAKITAVDANNTAKGHKSGQEYGSSRVDLYTGSITLTKVDANNTEKKLAGAEFTVHKVTTNGDENVVGEALKFDYDAKTGVYTYNPDSTRNNATIVVTGANGEVKVEGLDKGKYHFTETKAPNGYSINEAGKDIELSYTGEKATEKFVASGDLTLKDSELSSLPSTGGMGTYIFTIIGVVVMAGAAGAFFISRKKGSEE